ncbi:MerR family transcriptional regulator [Brevibacillus brevis]|uniref:MerR family transcriptional regulator n=1 Tax=Brevibacillus brevis TaxID=1393 RepID=UPI00165E4F1B|nr:MerR family transcriptional regulator [Brevibacillus brevis]
MFKISEFSRLSRIPLQTLRYYDQIGILKPAKIDDTTGYRYYCAEQLLQINRIVIFKELGFSLQQIAQLLHENIPAEQIRGMLRLKENEIQSLLEMEMSKLARIKERVQLVEREGRIEKEHEVVLKQVDGMHLISYSARGTAEDIPWLFQMFDSLLDASLKPSLTGPQTVLWKETGTKDQLFDFGVGYATKTESVKLPEQIERSFLPAETMATLLFRSDSTMKESACLDLATWIEQHGYCIRDEQPGREFYVPLSEEPGVELIEIQIPIVARGQSGHGE